MKGLILTLILAFLNTLGVQAEETSETQAQSLVESVNDISKLKSEVAKVGTIETPCPSCDGDPRFNFTMKLDKEEINLEKKIFFIKDNKSINVVLQRDEKSPTKMTVAFENPYRVCGKHYVGPSFGGSIMIDCIFYITEYEKQEIDIDLSKFPQPSPGETQSLVLSFTKKDITKGKYSLDAYFNGQGNPSIKIDKKFFGGGHNVVLRKPSSEE